MPEVKVNIENIRNVSIKSKVVDVKDEDAKIVTSVSFEYDGEPSQMEEILMLEAQNQPVHANLYTPQLAMAMGEG